MITTKGLHDILVGNAKQGNNKFLKTLLFYWYLSNLVITPRAQPYLPYNLPDKTSVSGRILEQNSLFYGVPAGSKCIYKHCQCLTWKQKKLLLPIHRDCQLKLPITSLFSLMNFSELSEIIVASSTFERVGALDTRMCMCSGLA